MLTPLLSRFVVLHFKQYKYVDFREVTVHMLYLEGITEETADFNSRCGMEQDEIQRHQGLRKNWPFS